MTNRELYNDSTTFAGFRTFEDKSSAAMDSLAVVPEPSTALLLGSAGVAMMFGRRRKRCA